jgi:hypothetical protein
VAGFCVKKRGLFIDQSFKQLHALAQTPYLVLFIHVATRSKLAMFKPPSVVTVGPQGQDARRASVPGTFRPIQVRGVRVRSW